MRSINNSLIDRFFIQILLQSFHKIRITETFNLKHNIYKDRLCLKISKRRPQILF